MAQLSSYIFEDLKELRDRNVELHQRNLKLETKLSELKELHSDTVMETLMSNDQIKKLKDDLAEAQENHHKDLLRLKQIIGELNSKVLRLNTQSDIVEEIYYDSD